MGMASSLTKYATAVFAIPILLGMELTVGVNPIVNEFVKDGKQFISVVFDLQNPVNDECYHYVKVPFGSGHRISVTPSEGYVISGLIYGSNEIFMCDSSLDEFVDVINIFYYDGDIIITVYVGGSRFRFGKVEGIFVPLTPGEYHYRFTRMGRSYTLDVNQTENTEEVAVSFASLYGKTAYTHKPRYGTKVDKLMDGEETIWKDDSGNKYVKECFAVNLTTTKLIGYRIDDLQESKCYYCIGDDNGYYNVQLSDFCRCFLYGEIFMQALLAKKKEEMSRGTIA